MWAGSREFDTSVVGALGEHVDDHGNRLRVLSVAELQVEAGTLVDRRRAGDGSLDVLARSLAHCAEAIRRVTGSWPERAVIRAATAAAHGCVAIVNKEHVVPASAMAAYWFGMLGDGVHLITLDEREATRRAEFMAKVGVFLGGDVGLLLAATSQEQRRAAYKAMITVGAYSEFASDYLRDNLRDSANDLVQRGCRAAVVDDADDILAGLAIGTVFVTTSRSEPAQETEEDVRFAAGLQQGGDYRVFKEHGGIVFMPPGIHSVKRACDWGEVASAQAVTSAQRIERLIMKREGLIARQERTTVADISVQGFVRLYDTLGGLSYQGSGAESLLDNVYGLQLFDARVSKRPVVWKRKVRSGPGHVHLAAERIIDRQRADAYGWRAGVRDAVDVCGNGERTIRDLTTRWTVDGSHDNAAAERHASLESGRAEDEILRMVRSLEADLSSPGSVATLQLIRLAQLAVFDLHWGPHLSRMRFLQRNVGALYGPEPGSPAAFERDADALFTGLQDDIRREVIRHSLGA